MPLSAQTLELLDELNKPSNIMADAIVSAMFSSARATLRTHQIIPDDKEASAELTAALYVYLKASTTAQLEQDSNNAQWINAWERHERRSMSRPALLDGETEGID